MFFCVGLLHEVLAENLLTYLRIFPVSGPGQGIALQRKTETW